jgi:hypothetical protein
MNNITKDHLFQGYLDNINQKLVCVEMEQMILWQFELPMLG